MPVPFLADGDHDPSWLSGFENNDHLISLCLPEIAIDKVIPSSLRCFQYGRPPFLATVLNPVLKLLGDIAQALARDSFALTISVEETDDALGLLKGLNQSVQKDPIKTTVAKFYAILMMFAEGVHCLLLCAPTPGTYGGEPSCDN